MKKVKIIYVAVVLSVILAEGGKSQAATNLYSGIHVIQQNDVYGSIDVWNDAIVDMMGGEVLSLDSFISSMVNISGGNVTGGLAAWGTSEVNISGGEIDWYLKASDWSTVNLNGGQITGWLYATDSSIINIYGYGFNYDPDAGSRNGGQLTGFWVDATPFSIVFLDNIEVGSTYYDHVALIPEPATILLLGLGAVMVRRKQ